jgi:hypothetical protein
LIYHIFLVLNLPLLQFVFIAKIIFIPHIIGIIVHGSEDVVETPELPSPLRCPMNSESVHYIHIRSNLPDQSSYTNTLSSAQSLPLTMINIDMI